MSQSMPQKNTIFDRVLQSKGIVDIRGELPQLKFEICKLTIETTHRILRNNPELSIQEQTLHDFVYSLQQISNVLYEFHIGPLGTRYPFKQLRESIDEAKLHLDAAMNIFNNQDRMLQRGQYILICKYKLEVAIDIIGGFPRSFT